MKDRLLEIDIKEYADRWNPDFVYYLWGAGLEGRRAVKVLGKHIKIAGIIDSDIQKQGTLFCGIEVCSLEKAVNTGNKIIITASAYLEIAEILESRRFLEDIDYTYWKKFAGIYFWYYKNQLYSYQIDISVTQRCSLNCRHCNMWMSMFKSPADRDLGDILHDIDAYFSCVDYVSVVNLLGGEPLLCNQLAEIIEYLGQKWGDRLGEIQIYTNGTIKPPDEILSVCVKHSVIMDISDYSNALPAIKRKVAGFISLMQDRLISYRIKASDQWLDFGFPDVNRQSAQEASEVFRLCRAPFRGLYDGKVYYCHLQASAEQLGLFKGNSNDWVELNSESRVPFLNLDLGYPKLGYITFCMRCDGCGKNNTRLVPVAQQISKRGSKA